MRVLNTIDSLFEKLNQYIMIITGVAVTSLILAGAIMRYVLHINFYGQEEIVLLVGFWMYFIGSISAAREKTHLNADMLSLFTKNQKILDGFAIFRDVLSLLICLLAAKWCLAYFGWSFPKNPKTSVYKIPLYIQKIPMILACLIWTLYLIRDCVRGWLRFRNDLRTENAEEGGEN